MIPDPTPPPGVPSGAGKRSEPARFVAIAAFVALGLHLGLALGSPIDAGDGLRFWGIQAVRYLPRWIAFTVYGFGFAMLAWIWMRPTQRAGSDPPPSKRTALVAPWVLDAVTALGATLLFFLLRSRYAFLGDNFLRVSEIESGALSRNERGVMWILHQLSDALGPDHGGARRAVLIGSFVAGSLFTFVAARQSRTLAATRDARVWIVAAFLCAGCVELFCGYLEVYPLVLAALLAAVFLAERVASSAAPRWTPLVAIVLLPILHFMTIFWLPALLCALLFRDSRRANGDEPARSWPRSRTLTLLAIALVAAGGLATFAGARTGVVLRWMPTEDRPYALFTIAHVADYMNAQFLGSVSGFLVAPIALWSRFATPRISVRELTLLLAWLVPAVGFFFFKPVLGSADWDVLATAAPFGVVYAASVVAPMWIERPLLARVFRTSVVLSVVTTLPWLLVQAGDASIIRIRELLPTERSDFYQTHPPYLQLGLLYEMNELPEAQHESYRLGAAANPRDARYPLNLAQLERRAGRLDSAESWAEAAYRAEPGQPEALEILFAVRRQTGRFAEALAAGAELLDRAHENGDQITKSIPAERLTEIEAECVRLWQSGLRPGGPAVP